MKPKLRAGVNPYKFGMVGSSDAHTGLAALEEDNFFGKTTPQETGPHRMTKTFFHEPKTGVTIMDWEVAVAGYAAVCATENTRESIWDAMQRKETYATTGSRLTVRFFETAPRPEDDRHRARYTSPIWYTPGTTNSFVNHASQSQERPAHSPTKTLKLNQTPDHIYKIKHKTT